MITRWCDNCKRQMEGKLEYVEVQFEKVKIKLVPMDDSEDICTNCVERILTKVHDPKDLKVKEKKK